MTIMSLLCPFLASGPSFQLSEIFLLIFFSPGVQVCRRQIEMRETRRNRYGGLLPARMKPVIQTL